MGGSGYNIRTKAGRVKRRILADVIRRVAEAAQGPTHCRGCFALGRTANRKTITPRVFCWMKTV
jgi:hypothetical protein